MIQLHHRCEILHHEQAGCVIIFGDTCRRAFASIPLKAFATRDGAALEIESNCARQKFTDPHPRSEHSGASCYITGSVRALQIRRSCACQEIENVAGPDSCFKSDSVARRCAYLKTCVCITCSLICTRKGPHTHIHTKIKKKTQSL